MGAWKGIVGASFGAAEFDRCCHALVWTAVAALLHAVLGLAPATLRLHREAPLTTHRCPGDKVPKTDVIRRVQQLLVTRHAGEHLAEPMPHPPA